MKNTSPHDALPVSQQIFQPEPALLSVIDDFAEDFPSAEERTEADTMSSSRKQSARSRPTPKNIKYTKTQTLSLPENADSNTLRSSVSVNNGPGQINMKKFSHKAQSVVSSQACQKMTAKRLRDSLKIERQSTSSKLVLIMVYIAIVAIVCSVCIHLISTKNSLTKMESSIILVQTVNSRLAKTIMNWQAMMVLDSRSVKYVLFATALIIIIIILVALSLQKSMQDLENLDTINDKTKTIYSLRSNVRMLVPAQFFSMIFWNNTDYKIRNDVPANQLLFELDVLADANNIVLNALSDSNNEVTDPIIKEILDGNVCQYVTSEYYLNCIQDTKGSVFGLLGLQSLYVQITQTMRQFATTPNPTFALTATLSTQFGNTHNNAYIVMFDIYDYSLVGTFTEATEANKAEIQDIFYRNLAAVLVALFLIRTVVLTKLQVFDLGIRRILRIIPYKIIEENKVMGCYLARTFQDELRVMKHIG